MRPQEHADVVAAAFDAAQSGRRLRLPALVSHYRFKPAYALVWLPYIAAYQMSNRFPLREPVELSMTALDRMVPFVPELLPVYVGYLAYFFIAVARLENDREVNRVFYSTHLQLLVSLAVFVLYPVRMPREMFYSAQIYGWADAFWRWFDAPNNCLPSLHAANVLLLMEVSWQRRGRWVALIAGAAIVVSTLFVKQHYAVDLLAGALVYALASAFLARLEIGGVDAEGRGHWRRARPS